MKSRRWFSFSFRVMIAFVTGAAIGLGVIRVMQASHPQAHHLMGITGPAGALYWLLVLIAGINEADRMAFYSIVVGLPVLYGLYAALLAKRPRWSTILWIAGIHLCGAVAMVAILACS